MRDTSNIVKDGTWASIVDKAAIIPYIENMHVQLPFSIDSQFVALTELKAGGFGIIYGGWDENLNLPVAIKELHPDLLQQEASLSAFQAEARLVARLEHPAICRLYTLKRAHGRVFMIMEFIDGGDLYQVQDRLAQQNRRLSPRAVLQVVRQVGLALQYAHLRVEPATGEPLHLVHRDIAPSNFMVSRRGEVKLIDFGIARMHGLSRPETMGGVIKGRPEYMSPEQISSPDHIDCRSDIYSLALVFLNSLTGDSVYGVSSNQYQLLERARLGQFDLYGFLERHGLPEALQEPLVSALRLNPAERTPTARDFVQQLEPYGRLIGFDEVEAQAELQAAVEAVFPPLDLKAAWEDFCKSRDAVVTRTMQLPQPDVPSEPALREVPKVAVHQRKAFGKRVLILFGFLAVVAAGSIYWLQTGDSGKSKDNSVQRPGPPETTSSVVTKTPPESLMNVNGKANVPVTPTKGGTLPENPAPKVPPKLTLKCTDARNSVHYSVNDKSGMLVNGRSDPIDAKPPWRVTLAMTVNGCDLEQTFYVERPNKDTIFTASFATATVKFTGTGISAQIIPVNVNPKYGFGSGCAEVISPPTTRELLGGKYEIMITRTKDKAKSTKQVTFEAGRTQECNLSNP